MLASELIKELQKIIDEGDDPKVEFYNSEDGNSISIDIVTRTYSGTILLE